MLRAVLRPGVRLLRSVLGTHGLSEQVRALGERLRPVEAPAPDRIDVNMMLHQSRGALLRQMPEGAATLVSAGCAGLWYFDWVAACYGPVARHIGIEFYTPKPDGLPGHVTWISNTVGDMHALPDRSCDLMFSGQNLEHLWTEEVASFLMEAARTVRPGGTLVIDSPNRAITAPSNWSHPEHTIELTVPEIRTLLGLAGFAITKEAGIWLCQDPRTGRLLPFDPNVPDAEWSMIERLLLARDNPEHAFIWWLEARRTDATPDRAGIEATLAAIYSQAWPERLRRTIVPAGLDTTTRADGVWITATPGAGVVLFGPYTPLRAGTYVATFHIEAPPGTAVLGRCEVCAGPEAAVLGQADIVGAGPVSIAFTLPALRFGLQFRVISDAGGFEARSDVGIVPS